MKDFIQRFLLAGLLALALFSCEKPDAPGPDVPEVPEIPEVPEVPEVNKQALYENLFAKTLLDYYYLWKKEIAGKLGHWQMDGDAAKQVRNARYKDLASGKEIDRWTTYYSDYKSFTDYLVGEEESGTFGFSYKLYYYENSINRVVAVVTYTSAGGPAEAAGLKRGDMIMTVNGREMFSNDYLDAANALSGAGHLTVTLRDGRTVELDSVHMYEDPVLLYEVLPFESGKVGYLCYTQFTGESCSRLIEACTSFRKEGISDLILDLRYNPGGSAYVEELLASMLAPEAEVEAGNVLGWTIYNDEWMEYFAARGEETKSCFKQDFKFDYFGKSYEFSTRGANVRVGRLFVIVESGSTSASEALICHLKAYMPVVLVGSRTGGKYCGGSPYSAESFYDSSADELGAEAAAEGRKYAENKGIYLMSFRFADRDGVTLCQPDGLAPDVKILDNPYDGHALGDPDETMLAVALETAGYKSSKTTKSDQPAPVRLTPVPGVSSREGYYVVSDVSGRNLSLSRAKMR